MSEDPQYRVAYNTLTLHVENLLGAYDSLSDLPNGVGTAMRAVARQLRQALADARAEIVVEVDHVD